MRAESTGEQLLEAKAQRNTFSPEEFSCFDLKLEHRNLLGEGQFGQVYCTSYTHPTTGERGEVALKLIREEKVFNHEVLVLSQVRHENIVAYFGDYTDGTNFYIITEFIAGGSLHDYLQRHQDKELPAKTIHTVATQLARAIDYLHTGIVPIIHRDIKSPNILLVLDGDEIRTVKLADVGLARPAPQHGTIMTSDAGTAFWTSPEVFCVPPGMRTYSFKADVYSFGVVLWELLMRQAPFPEFHASHTAPFILQLVLRGVQLPAPTAGPPCLRRLVQLCTAYSPAARPTMDVVRDGLVRALAVIEGDDRSDLFPLPAGPQEEPHEALMAKVMEDADISCIMATLDPAAQQAMRHFLDESMRVLCTL